MSADLLLRTAWSNKDIMEYLQCSVHKASNIRKTAIEKYDGAIVTLPRKVARDAVLKAIGVDLERELRVHEIAKQLKNEED